ncbi:hypothetical protein [Promicromonospora sukumoe]|uniref:hypothetical protein n=1 Tax=Promicromonospora sukumoe TaxID=88382 RepID=UPI000362E4D0|nr:hypothetical protein [Promicromonospora sukumoe]
MTLQKRWLATLSSALMALLCVLGGTQAAQAYDDRDLTALGGDRIVGTTNGASTGEVAPAAWTPNVSPLLTEEAAARNLTTADRNAALNNCPRLYACVAVGQGDGRHTVFFLYHCDTRTLTNFIDAGAITNHQSPGATVRFTGPGVSPLAFAPRVDPYSFNPLPYNRVDPC